MKASTSVISCVEKLGFPFKTPDPFLFCVYHKDFYPNGDDKMQAPKIGNGADFNMKADYRMYHGTRIPGFPQHPHRGFETLSATLQGLVDHTDSLGNAGRYGEGDLQWMTAGSGIVHGENFPLINRDKPNPTKFFQIWLNLPSKSKMVDPAFVMHWHEDIPKVVSQDTLTEVTVWAGSIFNKKGLSPPPDSWAANPENEVAVWYFVLQPGARFSIPAAEGGVDVNRMAYFTEGDELSVSGRVLTTHSVITLNAEQSVELYNPSTSIAEVLVLQGRPINEPVAQQGPFVMNTQDELRQAFSDYRKTQFGGWPWKEDAVVFPREKTRFALQRGVETYPPSSS